MGFGFFSVLSAREVIVVTFQNPTQTFFTE